MLIPINNITHIRKHAREISSSPTLLSPFEIKSSRCLLGRKQFPQGFPQEQQLQDKRERPAEKKERFHGEIQEVFSGRNTYGEAQRLSHSRGSAIPVSSGGRILNNEPSPARPCITISTDRMTLAVAFEFGHRMISRRRDQVRLSRIKIFVSSNRNIIDKNVPSC